MKNKIILFTLLLTVIVLCGSGKGELGFSCQGSQSFNNYTIDGTVHNSTTPCPYGCNTATGLCQNFPADNSTPYNLLLFCFAAISFVMAYIAFKFDPMKHASMQIFFLALSLFSVLNMLGVVRTSMDYLAITAFDEIINSSLTVWIYGTMLVVFYITIFYIPKLISYIQEQRKQRKER